MSARPWSPALLCRTAAAGLLLLSSVAAQAEFAVAVSPPRFELQARPGQVLRQTIEVSNASMAAGRYRLRTADWTYAPDGTVHFRDDIAAGSCRPWVALERLELTVGPGRPYRFRFEVTPPADAPVAECRFAIMVEGHEQNTIPGSLNMVFNGRIAVIVYVAVGGAQARLSVVGTTLQKVNGQTMPALQVRNEGTAHGRLAGFLQGRDADLPQLDFTPATSPILPGETRAIPLLPSRPGDPEGQVVLRYPVSVKGRLEWGRNQSQDIDLRFAP